MAARTARRSLGRSILVAVMIAVPVAGMAGAAVVTASMEATPAELVALQLGAEAEAVLQVVAPPDNDVRQEVSAPVQGWWDTGAGSYEIRNEGDQVDPSTLVEGELISESLGTAVVETPSGLRAVPAVEGDLLRPELEGRYDLIDGRAPSTAGDVVLTPALLESLDIAIGEEATIATPDGEIAVDVVGVYRSSDTSVTSEELLAAPDTLAEGTMIPNRYFLLDQELTWDDVLALNEQGVIAASRTVLLGNDPTPGARPSDLTLFGLGGGVLAFAALIGGFLLFQVVLLAAAAFMVGARQQQRALAVLASVGGDRRLMRATVTAGGVVLGLVGGLLGIMLGIGGAAVAIPLLSGGRAMSFPGFHLPWLMLAVTVLLAVLAGWAAALVPARVASRIDIVPALRGARRPPTPRRAARITALVVVIVGAALLLIGGVTLVIARAAAAAAMAELEPSPVPPEVDIIAVVVIGLGAVVVQLGVVLALPAVLRLLARATGGARSALRLAARDAGRNSARTVPVTAAVMTTVFLASFIMSVLSAGQSETDKTYQAEAPANSVSVSTIVYDYVSQEEAVFDNIPGIESAILEISPDARVAVVEGTPSEPSIRYDPVTGTPTLGESSSGSTVARVFPANRDCRAVFSNDPELGDPRECEGSPEEIQGLYSGYMLRSDIAIGEPDDLEVFLGEPLSAESRAMLARGGAVALNPLLVEDGEVTIDRLPAEQFVVEPDEFADPAAFPPESSDRLPAAMQVLSAGLGGRILISPETAERLDIAARPQLLIAQLPEEPTLAQRDAFTALSQDLTGDPYRFYPYIETGPPDTSTLATWALVAVSAVIALAASSIAIGLARIDGRRDEAILGAMGATRSLRRAVSLWQAILLAGVGSLIGAALGVLTAGALALPGGPLPFAPPWVPLAIVAVGVPVLIGLGAWLFAGRSTALRTDRTAIS
ncbi:hypothetical protein OVN18_02135 [Microcella daejeonensis]|uniref:FtsX-like permease family protein n=1 Tax=Microcella daejeonensis TaxID=2994971 RepID=A0A9E8MLS7_9MICO|nr:FtsX-like permease family protein [Microcella daejeonensis]WAB81843.1 hypothetical protein OVN18_02135 [Microcella daejeonensis]